MFDSHEFKREYFHYTMRNFLGGGKLLSLLSSPVALSLSVKLVDLLIAKAVLPRASL